MEKLIVIKVEEEKRDELSVEAKKRGLSLSGYCRMVLFDTLPDHQAKATA